MPALSVRLGNVLFVSDGLFDVPGAAVPPEHSIDTVVRRDSGAPLAVRMRPAALEEVVGQQHLLGPGSPLRRLIEGSGAASVLLYGPPGTGKTTLAALISQATGRRFEALSALSAGVKEVRAVIDMARRRLSAGEQTVLFIDEVHRFSKTQQDALLAAVENRIVLLVGATTENPSFSVVSPLLSRSPTSARYSAALSPTRVVSRASTPSPTPRSITSSVSRAAMPAAR
jgi:putative ATPase